MNMTTYYLPKSIGRDYTRPSRSKKTTPYDPAQDIASFEARREQIAELLSGYLSEDNTSGITYCNGQLKIVDEAIAKVRAREVARGEVRR